MKNLLTTLLALGLILMTYLYVNSISKHDSVSKKITESNTSKPLKDSNKGIEAPKINKISKHEHHDNKPHEHTHHQKSVNEGKLDTNIDSHIPQDIRELLCVPESQNDTCELSLKYNLESVLLTDEGNQLASEINVTLTSDNFEAMLEQLAINKATEQAYERESKYKNQMVDILTNISGISSNNLACSDKICATSITYKNEESLQSFHKQFFNSNGEKGNLFIAHLDYQENTDSEVRLMFFPGNKGAVLERMK